MHSNKLNMISNAFIKWFNSGSFRHRILIKIKFPNKIAYTKCIFYSVFFKLALNELFSKDALNLISDMSIWLWKLEILLKIFN